MFGLSLAKILFTLAVVAAVWFVFFRVRRGKTPARAEAAAARRREEPTRLQAEEMVKCPACDTYVPRDAARDCGRADCPYRR